MSKLTKWDKAFTHTIQLLILGLLALLISGTGGILGYTLGAMDRSLSSKTMVIAPATDWLTLETANYIMRYPATWVLNRPSPDERTSTGSSKYLYAAELTSPSGMFRLEISIISDQAVPGKMLLNDPFQKTVVDVGGNRNSGVEYYRVDDNGERTGEAVNIVISADDITADTEPGQPYVFTFGNGMGLIDFEKSNLDTATIINLYSIERQEVIKMLKTFTDK